MCQSEILFCLLSPSLHGWKLCSHFLSATEIIGIDKVIEIRTQTLRIGPCLTAERKAPGCGLAGLVWVPEVCRMWWWGAAWCPPSPSWPPLPLIRTRNRRTQRAERRAFSCSEGNEGRDLGIGDGEPHQRACLCLKSSSPMTPKWTLGCASHWSLAFVRLGMVLFRDTPYWGWLTGNPHGNQTLFSGSGSTISRHPCLPRPIRRMNIGRRAADTWRAATLSTPAPLGRDRPCAEPPKPQAPMMSTGSVGSKGTKHMHRLATQVVSLQQAGFVQMFFKQ